MKKRGLLFISLFAGVGIFGLLFVKPAFNYLSGYLSKSEEVSANILLVEGWLPEYAIDMAFSEFNKNKYEYVITTGLKIPEYYLVSMDGYLVFYPKRRIVLNSGISNHSIEIDAYSELNGDNAARFNLFINDSVVGSFEAEKRKRKYNINWKGDLTTIDSIMVQFTNDAIGDFGDRNLYVKEIIIDHKFVMEYQKNSEYIIGALGSSWRIKNDFTSYAELARNRLLSLGMDSAKIKAIDSKRARINRTLTSALAFRDWLRTTNIPVKGINIVTVGTHARRTWMTYNKILDGKHKIGILSLPDYKNNFSRKYKILKTIRETLGIIYYWIILIPY
ncbi:MAG: carbohydrate-binding domain-containing protein [Bacteroidales bacterium]